MSATQAHPPLHGIHLSFAISAHARLVVATAVLVALAALGVALALTLPVEPAHAPTSFLGPSR